MIPKYYARSEADKRFDDQIRSNVKKGGDKAMMALYLQNQEILNLLRRMDIAKNTAPNIGGDYYETRVKIEEETNI